MMHSFYMETHITAHFDPKQAAPVKLKKFNYIFRKKKKKAICNSFS